MVSNAITNQTKQRNTVSFICYSHNYKRNVMNADIKTYTDTKRNNYIIKKKTYTVV